MKVLFGTFCNARTIFTSSSISITLVYILHDTKFNFWAKIDCQYVFQAVKMNITLVGYELYITVKAAQITMITPLLKKRPYTPVLYETMVSTRDVANKTYVLSRIENMEPFYFVRSGEHNESLQIYGFLVKNYYVLAYVCNLGRITRLGCRYTYHAPIIRPINFDKIEEYNREQLKSTAEVASWNNEDREKIMKYLHEN
jgi:hypothetical protein